MQTNDVYMNPSTIASWLVSVKAPPLPTSRQLPDRHPLRPSSVPMINTFCSDAVPDRPDKPNRSLRIPPHPTRMTLLRRILPSAQRILTDATVYSRSNRASFDVVKIGLELTDPDRYARSISILSLCIENFPTQQ
jgi:hypothetical protein